MKSHSVHRPLFGMSHLRSPRFRARLIWSPKCPSSHHSQLHHLGLPSCCPHIFQRSLSHRLPSRPGNCNRRLSRLLRRCLGCRIRLVAGFHLVQECPTLPLHLSPKSLRCRRRLLSRDSRHQLRCTRKRSRCPALLLLLKSRSCLSVSRWSLELANGHHLEFQAWRHGARTLRPRRRFAAPLPPDLHRSLLLLERVPHMRSGGALHRGRCSERHRLRGSCSPPCPR